MPSDIADVQGGKAYGKRMEMLHSNLDDINKQFLEDEAYQEVEDLAEQLVAMKEKFIECDRDNSGDLNMMDVKYLMEKLDKAKSHLEVKKMISEVDTTGEGVINYTDFVRMMLGPKSSVLKLILMFEGKMKSKEQPKGPAPKRDLTSLP